MAEIGKNWQEWPKLKKKKRTEIGKSGRKWSKLAKMGIIGRWLDLAKIAKNCQN